MKALGTLFLFLFLLGCVQPAPETIAMDIPAEPIPVTQPTVHETPPPLPTDVNFFIISSEKGPAFDKVDAKTTKDVQAECAFDTCTLTFAYYPALESGQVLHFNSTDYNFLNATEMTVKDPHYLILALTTDPIMKNGIFSYAKNDHTYVSNYFCRNLFL